MVVMKSAVKLFGVILVLCLLTLVYIVQDDFRQRISYTTDKLVTEDTTWTKQPYVRRPLMSNYLRYLLYPSFPCGAGEEHLLGTFVISAVANFAQRSAIRETWGQPLMTLGQYHQKSARNATFLYFVLGRTDNQTLQDNLSKEAIEHADIIQEDFQDTYLNLTLKSVMILRWVSTFCPRIRFAFKTDDDMFVNSNSLLSHLQSLKVQSKVLLGRIVIGAKPIRTKKSKWFAPPESFDEIAYPNYLSGTGYVMSGDVADLLYAQVSQVPFFHLEDVYVTGMLAKKAHIKPTNHNGFKQYKNDIKRCQYKNSLTIHQVSPDDNRSIWTDVNNQTLTCPVSTKSPKS